MFKIEKSQGILFDIVIIILFNIKNMIDLKEVVQQGKTS